MKQVLHFLKTYFIQIVLVIIAVLLLVMATGSVDTLSLESEEEVDVYLGFVDKIGNWVLLLTMVGVISFIAITGKGKEFDSNIALSLENLHESKRFDQMELDMENAPEEVKQMVALGNSLLKLANTLLQSEAIETVTEVGDDLLDGVETKEDN